MCPESDQKVVIFVKTAKNGNILAAWGMFFAIILTLPLMNIVTWTEVGAFALMGALIGVYASRAVAMTQMPQLVALFNGFGGLASALVAVSYFFSNFSNSESAVNIFCCVRRMTSVSGVVISMSGGESEIFFLTD